MNEKQKILEKDRCNSSTSPMKKSSQRLFSPVDSDQELNDLEVATVLAEDQSNGKAKKTPVKFKRLNNDTPAKATNSPSRPSTVMTNVQRGNVQTSTPSIVQSVHVSVHQMAAQGELVLLQEHLEESFSDLDMYDESGLTPLVWASAHGQLSTVEFLIRSGANLSVSGNHGENALLLSCSNGHTEIVEFLLSLGMDVNYTDESGSTALMYAAFNNHPACVKTLLEHGADLTGTNQDRNTAMDLAVAQGHKGVQHVIEKHMLSLFENMT